MFAQQNQLNRLLHESDLTSDSYFGNPYNLGYEQYGMEHIDRYSQRSTLQETDEIEAIAILGYN